MEPKQVHLEDNIGKEEGRLGKEIESQKHVEELPEDPKLHLRLI